MHPRVEAGKLYTKWNVYEFKKVSEYVNGNMLRHASLEMFNRRQTLWWMSRWTRTQSAAACLRWTSGDGESYHNGNDKILNDTAWGYESVVACIPTLTWQNVSVDIHTWIFTSTPANAIGKPESSRARYASRPYTTHIIGSCPMLMWWSLALVLAP